ncbi:MAG: hypothetical protein ACYDH0_11015 [Candidatus Aminicenantales bacterium]
MKPIIRKAFPAALFLLEAQAAASAVWLRPGAGRSVLSLVLLVPAFIVALGLGFAYGARFLSRRNGRASSEIIPRLVASCAPLVLLDLVFLQFAVFLRDVRTVLPWVAVLGSCWLLAAYISKSKSSGAPQERRFDPGRMSRMLFAAACLIYVFLATGLVVPPQPFTGDEPHYLVITQSLLSDGDIDVFNNYRDGEYKAFYPAPLVSHALPGERGPQHDFSRHLPGISILVLPAYLAGEKAGEILAPGPDRAELRMRILVFFSRLPICLLAAFLSAVFFLLAFRITGRKGPSFLAWAVFSFTGPFLPFSQLIYPEIPAALISILIVLFVILAEKPSPSALWLAGMGIAILPWFGVKYLVLSAALFAFCLPALRRSGARRPKQFLPLILSPAVSGVAYLCYFWVLYGTLSPAAAYGSSFSESDSLVRATRILPPVVEAIRMGLGHLFDQRFGVIPNSAVYILLFAGAVMLCKKIRKTAIPLLVLFVAFWALNAAYRVWGGHCPPGRLLVPVIWIPGVFLAVVFSAGKSRMRNAILCGTIGLSAATALAGILEPRLFYYDNLYAAFPGPDTFNKLLSSLSNSMIDFRNWAPSFDNWKALMSPATASWLIAAAIAVFIFARRSGTEAAPARRFSAAGHAAVILALSIAILGYAFFNVRTGQRAPLAGGVEVLFQDENTHGMEPVGFWTRGTSAATVLIRAPERLSRIRVVLASPVAGRTSVQAGMAERAVVRPEKNAPPATIEFLSPVGFHRPDGYYYSLRIRDSSSFVPYQLDNRVGDNRTLGVQVSLGTDQDN